MLPLLVAGLVTAGCSSSGSSSISEDSAPAVGTGRSSESQQIAPQQPVPPRDDRQVVRTAELGIETGDVPGTAARARGLAESAGGHLAEEDGSRGDAHLVVKVPAAQLDRLLDQLAGLGEVTSRNQRAEDVTDQLVDTRSRIDSQRASVDRLRELMARAGSVGEIVQIESELTSRETELDALLRRQAALAGQVELATVDVRVSAAERPEGGGFLAGLSGGWEALRGFGMFALTALGAVLPFAAVLALPVAAGGLLLRRRRLRRSQP
ncbi:hypothetical protein GCM10010470_62620 [Saccharopolyspora taberi]|uniref:DUF4349 domain-containing protein n=1 Tax=Saccharopolyspora taberi TaxID=60895 RepID=A0ABN3VM45_9PSEU